MKTLHLINKSLFGFSAFIALTVLLATRISAASEFNQNAVRVVHLEVEAADARILEVSTANGDITVTGTDSNLVIIDAEIHVNGRKGETCEDIASRVRMLTVQRGDRLVIDPDLPRKMGYSISITYTILMPSRLGADMETANGDLNLNNSSGVTRLESTNGSISAFMVSGDLSASTVNGSILLSKIISSKLSAETVNGLIQCQFISKAPDAIDISTINGSIEITLPRGANAALSADTVNGGLNINTGQGHITSKSRGSIEMLIGNGSGLYDLSSVNGSIEVVVANPPD